VGPTKYPVQSVQGFFSRAKEPGNDDNHSLPSGTEIKVTGAVCVVPLYAFLVCTGKNFTCSGAFLYL